MSTPRLRMVRCVALCERPALEQVARDGLEPESATARRVRDAV